MIEDKETKNSIKRAIEKEGDIEKIVCCVNRNALASEEVALKLSDAVSSKIEKLEDTYFCTVLFARNILLASKKLGLELANRVNIKVLALKIEKEEDVRRIGLCVRGIAKASKEVGLELANRVNIKVLASKIGKEEDVIKIGVCMGGITNASKEMALKLASAVSSEIGKREDMRGIEVFMTDVMGADREVAREIVNRLNPELREELQKSEWLK